MNGSMRPRSREGTASSPTIQMTKPPNRRLATDAPRRADPLVEIARQCPTAAAMPFNAPSTRRRARIALRTTAARAGREDRASAASLLARRQVQAARRDSASLWTGRTSPQTGPAPPPQPPPREAAARSGDTSTEISTELGLGAALTLDQLDGPLAGLSSGAIIPIASPWTPASAPTREWRSPTRFTTERGGSLPRRGSGHLGGQTIPSKTKPDQTNPSKIAWFYLVLFVRIGAFQWVTANPNKNISPHVTLCPKRHTHVLSGCLRAASIVGIRADPLTEKDSIGFG